MVTGLREAPDNLKCEWLIQTTEAKLRKTVQEIASQSQQHFSTTLERLCDIFPDLENDLTIRQKVEKLASLSSQPMPSEILQLLFQMEEQFGKLTENAMSDQEKFLVLSKKIHHVHFSKLREDRHFRDQMDTYDSLKKVFLDQASEHMVKKNDHGKQNQQNQCDGH